MIEPCTYVAGRHPHHSNLAGMAAVLIVLVGSPSRGADLAAERQTLLESFRAQVEELAVWCDEHSLGEQAAATRAWPLVERPFELVLVAPIENPTDPLAGDAPADGDVAAWREEFRTLRNSQAESLYVLALQCVQEGELTLAFRLAHEAFRENPDHAEARRILGFEKNGDGWTTPFARTQTKAGRVYDAEFGWLPADQVERYRAGERQYGGKWMSVEEEAQKRQKMVKGWVVRSEHFEIKTNHSLEAGVKLARQLDFMYGVWRQVFVRFFMNDRDELPKLFEKGSPKSFQRIKFNVRYYRTRDEYLAALKPIEPNIEITTGYYEADKKLAHFYFADDALLGNWYHEATHQLFSQSRPTKGPGRVSNFWAVEGVACYMESLREDGQWARLGGPHAMRVQNARARFHGESGEEPYYVPLAELTTLGMKGLQAREDIAPMYSQMGGLAHFFIHSTDRPRREAFVEYLKTIYAAKDGPGALAEATGETFAELDAAYNRFLEATAAEPHLRRNP